MLRLSVMCDIGKMCGFLVSGFFKSFYITATIRNQDIFNFFM